MLEIPLRAGALAYPTNVMIAVLLAATAPAADAPASQPISVQTALLVILAIGLGLAVKTLLDLHRRVAVLSAHVRATPRARPAPAVAPAAALPPELVAVITAAVYASTEGEVRIVSINAESQNLSWAWEGRRQIFGSHKVR